MLATMLSLAGLAQSASAAPKLPSVYTGGPQHVSYGSALLTGAVNPNGSDASYYFQYGLTKAYGGQSAIADAGAGTKTVNVKLPITGLQPLTVYHYRLVAVNAAGAAMGVDKTLLTTKVPLSLAILAVPNPVSYGGIVTIRGTLSGTGNANTAVVLQASPFPYAQGFANLGNPELTLADGGFSFPLTSLNTTTEFRVATTTKPAVLSPVVTETVIPRIESHFSRTRRRHVVRIFGTVAPAQDGMAVGILRFAHGRNVLVAGTILRHAGATRSKFSLRVRLRPGIYRVLVRTSGPLASGYGAPLLIR